MREKISGEADILNLNNSISNNCEKSHWGTRLKSSVSKWMFLLFHTCFRTIKGEMQGSREKWTLSVLNFFLWKKKFNTDNACRKFICRHIYRGVWKGTWAEEGTDLWWGCIWGFISPKGSSDAGMIFQSCPKLQQETLYPYKNQGTLQRL